MKKPNINIKKMVIIKLINCLNGLFQIYIIMLFKKAKNKNKFFNLQVFFLNLKDKKRCIKKTF